MFIIRHKFWFLGLSAFFIALAVAGIAKFGLKEGIDFAGGTLWQIQLEDEAVSIDDVRETFKNDLNIEDVVIVPESASQSLLLRFGTITEVEHQAYFASVQKKYSNAKELRFETLGPTIGNEIRERALWAFVFVLLGISLYVAFAFREVSFPVSSWKYGVITLLTLFHDALIPTGFFALLGYLRNAEVDTNFVVAILVVMGFSVHDTIVVFDRIRENLRLTRDRKFDFNTLVGKSINETMARSINTSLTLVIVLVALYLLGAGSLSYFVLVILLGTVIGTYSSICVASPLLTLWKKSA